jgi:hypothetical protein
MRIISSNARCSVEIEHDAQDNYASFSISGLVDLGHGRFSGENQDVHFLNLATFVAQLDAYILNRSLRPTLEGTYDTKVIVWTPEAHRNVVMLSFSIGDADAGAPTTNYRFEGSFAIDQDMLSRLLVDFRELASAS